MEWVIIDKNYFNYLYQFDTRIGFIEYGNKLKLHIGVLLEINQHKFYVPVSSPKPKHHNMANNLDFHKIQDSNKRLIAVLNLNNMIPVKDEYVTKLRYSEISNYRKFNSLQQLNNYIYLLQLEKSIIDTLEILLKRKAQKLYNKCLQYPQSKLAKRSCNFKLLESKSLEFTPNVQRR